MTRVGLLLGPMIADGYAVRRSGIRWLHEEGYLCKPGEAVAYCNISVRPRGRPASDSDPFGIEARDLQVAFASRIGGRLYRAPHSSHGGFLDQLPEYHRWQPDSVIGQIECDASEGFAENGTSPLRLMFLAGKRRTELAEERSGLLTGWHGRRRAWWGGTTSGVGTVVSLGICEQHGVIAGERFAFLELFEALRGPVQFVHISDVPLVPCARVVIEQVLRGPEQNEAIAADFARSFAAGPAVPSPKDWIFGAALIASLQQTPLTESYDMLTRAGLFRTGPADAVILSLNSEAPMILRHKRLGYHVKLHRFRLMEASPMVQGWLHGNFEPVMRSIDEIRRDYEELFDTLRARSNLKIILFNVVSTAGNEDIVTYAPYDRPMGSLLTSIRAKEINLMAHDLVRTYGASLIDIDAIAADIGVGDHLPDTVHGSGLMNSETRAELLRVLRDLRIPGCEPNASENLELHA